MKIKRFKAIIISLISVLALGEGFVNFVHSVNQSPSIIVVNGIPSKKVMSDIEGTESVNLSESERSSYRLLITKRDKNISGLQGRIRNYYLA